MAYIGRDTDKISNVEVLDNITFDGSSSYTLQKGGSNFTPSSANTLLLSIDGVVQAGNFTVSGSTIDFGTAVAGTSTCDFVLHYGVGLITLPSDGTVTTAKLGDSSVTTAKLNDSAVTTAKLNDASVSLAKLTATGTKDATTFLRGDNTFAEAGGGKVIQYKASYDSASIGLSTTSWTDTNLSITFTPVSASNRIVLKGMVQVYADGAPSYHGNMEYKVLNGSSTVMETYSVYSGYGGTEALFNGMLPFNVYETTAGNTNARTYKVQVRNTDTNSGAHYNQYSGYSALEVWEIDY